MGGKKQSQRTKNNARPSSSGRSAELLHSQVKFGEGLTPTTIFPTAATAKLPLFPSLAGTVIETTAPPEFALCFKKLNKKDPITKTKALQELTEIVNNSKVSDVVAVLPTWAHFYRVLTIDLDRKVREATQVCHAAIVRWSGRQLAPQLRALAPSWILAQYDDHAPAQSAAYNSLTSTFPDNKLPEVISFCREEIMSVIMENLLGAADDVINKKVAEEERDAALSLTRTSALRALQLVAVKLPIEQHQWLNTALKPLEDHAAFWKLATHCDANIRSAWYTSIASVAVVAVSLRTRAVATLATNKETHSTAARHRLAALKHICDSIPDWYDLIEKKDVFRKRILEVAESGGYGEARQTSTLLVSLLNHLPSDITTREFYIEFFDNAFKGLEKKQVLISKSERQHWLNGIVQCILNLSINEAKDESETGIKIAVAKLAEIASIPGSIFPSLASIPLKWIVSSSPKISLLLIHFWHSLSCSLLSKLTSPSIEVLQSQSQLLHTLKTSTIPKKQKSIKFDGDSPIETIETIEKIDEKLLERYHRDLNNLVSKLCARYFEIAQNEKRNDIISILFGILSEFKSDIIKTIAKELSMESPYKLYEGMVKFWMYEECMQSNDLVNLVFLMMESMSEDEQELVFKSFDNLPTSVRVWCIQKCSSSCIVAASSWVRGAGKALKLVAETEIGAGGLLLTQKGKEGFLITDEAVTGILETLKERVGKVWQNSDTVGTVGEKEIDIEETEREDSDADHACITGCQAVTMLAAANRIVPKYEDLILELLRVAANVQAGYSISVDTWKEVVSSIQDGVAAISDRDRHALWGNAKDILHEFCFSKTELNINKIERATSLCPYLLQSDHGPINEIELEELTRIILQDTQSNLETEIHALRHDCVTMRLNCLFDDDNDLIKRIIQDCDKETIEEMTKESFISDANSLLFRVTYLQNIFFNNERDDENEDSWCDVLLNNKYVLEQFSKVLHDYSVISTLYESHAFWPHYQLISDTYTRIQYILEELIFPSLSAQTFCAVSTHICQLGIEKGYYWSRAAAYVMKIKECDEVKKIGDDDLMGNLTANGYFHTLLWSTQSPDISRLRALYAVMVRSIYVTYPSLSNDEFVKDAIKGGDDATAEVIVNFYYKNQDTMLYESEISQHSWQQVVTVSAVLEYLSELVLQRGWTLPSVHWDFINITLTSLAMKPEYTTKCAMLSRSLLGLLARVSAFVGNFRKRAESEEPSKDIGDMIVEWRDVFQAPATGNFITFLMGILENADKLQMSIPTVAIISATIQACQSEAANLLHTTNNRVNDQVWELWKACVNILGKESPLPTQYVAYHAMIMTYKALVLYDAEQLSLWSMRSEDDNSTPKLAVTFLRPAITGLLNTLMDMLEPYQLGIDFVTPTPHTTLHRLSSSLALLWSAIHQLYSKQHADLQQHYMQLCREERYGELLVYLCVRLCPRSAGTTELVTPYIQEMFDTRPEPDVYDISPLPAHYCYVLSSCMSSWSVPSARAAVLSVRAQGWLTAAVRNYVSAGIVRREMTGLMDAKNTMDDVTVTIHWSTFEAHISVLVEERPLELVVQYARDHPLTPPRPAPPHNKPSIIANMHWITMYLAYQNGSLSSAVAMWCTLVRGRVSRASQCYICYCRLQPTSGRLPSVPCRQCQNKFHTECIRKWFQSSSKSNCPLCRANF